MMKRFSAVFLLLAFSAMFSTVTACGQTKTVWEIGKDDRSNREFTARPNDHVVYEVSKGDWAHDWPGEQRSGSSYEIRFNLDTVPRGTFSLRASVLASYPRTPALLVQINGHKGLYYLHPKSLTLGDQRYRASDVVTVKVPADYLIKGANSLTLSLAKGQTAEAGAKNSGTIAYDFISLANDPHANYPTRTIRADVKPTIFYLQKEGHLVEMVDAFLQLGQKRPAGMAVLSIEGKRYTANIPATNDLGEERLQFEVPEWQGTVTASLKVTAGSHETFKLPLTAARKWTIFMVPHTHVDIGYTDYQGKVAENQANTLVEAAELIKKYPDFRFATDGSWNLQQLLETRSAAQRDEILGLIREDKIGVPAQYFNLLTGYASLETLYRSLYYSKSLSHQYNLPFVYANTTDVPTYTGAYPSVLASAGIKYWTVAGNGDRAPVLSHEQWNEKSPFWWEGPDGKKVLFWYSRGYSQIGSTFGRDPQADSVHEALPIFLDQYNKPGYKPDAVLMYGAQDENTDLRPEVATFAATWNRTYAYPKLQYATFYDFFNYLEKHYNTELSTYKGDMGPYWEDGIGSDAYYAAVDRQNQSDALSSEIVSTVSHIVNSDVHVPKAELESAWNNILLFAEHTWGAARSIGQPDSQETVKQLGVKDNYATQARFELEDITNRSLSQLVQKIHIPARTLVVFNSLNWRRSSLIEVDLNQNEELVDLTTHETVPVEILSTKENFTHIRFLASDLPPVGYKCFRIRAASKEGQAAVDFNPVIENKYYRVAVDAESGAVRSIFDKQLQRELVDSHSPYRFGQYLYVTGGDPKGDGQTQMIHPFDSLPTAALVVHYATKGEYLGAEKTPWGYSIKLHSSAVNTPEIGLELLLFDNEKKLEFRYSVQKTYTTAKEAAYFSFPMAVAFPKFEYATQQGWVDPSHDLLKGASLEWFSIQKWMAVYDSHLAVGIVPVDVSLASFGDINRGEWPGEFHPKTPTIFSYAMNNYWHTNYRAGQGGTFTFRYVVTSAEHLDPSALSHLGWESMEAPALDAVINQDKAGNPDEPLPAEGTSFLEEDAANIVLVTWKLAEDNKGTILRLQETAGRTTEVSLRLPHAKIQSANLCDAVEDKLRDLDVADNQIHLTFHSHEVLTVRLVP